MFVLFAFPEQQRTFAAAGSGIKGRVFLLPSCDSLPGLGSHLNLITSHGSFSVEGSWAVDAAEFTCGYFITYKCQGHGYWSVSLVR